MMRAIACAIVLATLVTACGESDAERGSSQPQGTQLELTLGTKNFTESVVVGELYRRALAANGYNVTLRKNIGSTEVVDEALQRGDIDAYPEYLGVAATVVAGEAATARSAAETYRIARDFYASRHQALSQPTPFENVDAIATTRYFAQREHLRTITDLRRLKHFTLGARPEFETRYQGLAGLQKGYGLTNAQFKPVAIGAQYTASTRATSMRPTCSPPTASCPRGTTRCSSTPSGCSATSTSRSSSTATSSTGSAAIASCGSSTTSTGASPRTR